MNVSHLMSFPFVFRKEDDGVGQRGGGRLHLLHHHLTGAIDGEDVAGEVLAWPPCCSTGRAGDFGKETVMCFRQKQTNTVH